MNKIYVLPNYINTNWINANDANTELTEVEIVDNMCRLKYDTFHDLLFFDDTIQFDALFCDNCVCFPRSMFNTIQENRIKSYRACIWYPLVKDKIPTAHSKIIEYTSTTNIIDLNNSIRDLPFIRLCVMSSKDIKIPLYKNWFEASKDLLLSERTKNLLNNQACINKEMVHLFIREFKNYIWECRCFWSHQKLTAVSLPVDRFFDQKEKHEIINFFVKYGQYIPYKSAVIDIGFTNKIELIEFNSFGPDLNATSGNFSWREDAYNLLFSNITLFR
ncbi:MAG: hypothetical protein EOP34_06770 [Rickettsiales bacterium]|nr:MAG: hypothetical protein EOP34_06770 [Rickettsiales bacterium]